MKRSIFSLVWAIGLSATITLAQDLNNTVGLGVRGGVTFYRSDDFAQATELPYSNAFLAHHLSGHFAYELSVNYGQVSGNLQKKQAFWTDFAGAGLLGRIAPFGGKAIRPYIAGGVEYFTTNPRRFNRKNSYEKNNFSTPLGGGLGFIIGERLAFDLRGLYHFVNNDRLDKKLKGANDGFVSATAGLTWLLRGNPDPDRDGLTNRDEKMRGTNPRLQDTDRDGIKDGAEVHTFRTDPLAIDSDSDGLSDLDEIKKYKSDPNQADTDQDGLADGEEISKYQTNLLKGDTDDDDLSDAEELQVHKTNANLADSDGDSLKDGEEIGRYQTQPLEIDSDSDGLLDGDEVKKHQTDPLKQDTDGGGIADATEVNRGTNPLVADDDVPREILKVENNAPIILDGVVFETGRAVISVESEAILTKAFNTLEYYPEMRVAIHGHTDNTGGLRTNMRLSQARADAVKAYLVARGIASERIVTKGFGPYQPIAPNDSPESRRQNRRIEFSRIN
jgi:outer membrane protein OmpA-like peptidoglycan-associated protein